MRIIALKTLRDFWERNPDAQAALKFWHGKMKKGTYRTPQEVILAFKDSDTASDDRVIFNIAKNKYRLVVRIRYDKQICWIRFLGTHKEYDKFEF